MQTFRNYILDHFIVTQNCIILCCW